MGRNWDEKAVFLRALEIPPLERNAYLVATCPTAEAKARIESLLARHAADRSPLPNWHHAGSVAAPGASGALGAATLSRVDEFEFTRELGRGGMGVVYLARDALLGRLAAVKVLAPHLVDSDQAVERFRQEGRAVATLNHPGIVPVYRAACSNGRHYIAMEYVEGETLHDRIRAALPPAGDATPTGDLPIVFRDVLVIRDAARIVAAVAEALDHAHRHGVIHRDVKPSNVIVDNAGDPHLTDFGIAKMTGGEALTTTGDLAGTVHYMSPEQTEESATAIDHRSDVFSLGVVLYELLTLRRPFEGPTQQRVIEAIRRDEPPDLHSANSLVPVDLATICHKALEKRPQNRYQTAAHMAADLRAFLAGDPILARPPSAVRRVRRWAKRHRASLAAVSVVLSVGVAASSVVLVVLHQQGRLCLLELDAGAGPARGAQAVIRRISEDGWEVGEPVSVGALPTSTRVVPGVYRLSVVAEDGRFVETTVSLLRPGEERRITMSPPVQPGSTEGMVFVPGGTCICGTSDGTGTDGARSVRIAPFFIDRTEVSNGDYRRFCEATGTPLPAHFSMPEFAGTPDDFPAVGMTWEEAEAYARWVGKRLPTAAEWECAMRAPDDRLLPWGDAIVDLPETNVRALQRSAAGPPALSLPEYRKHVLPVDSRPDLATPSGILHAATNVREWTSTIVVGRTTVVITKGASWYRDPTLTNLAALPTQPLETIDTNDADLPMVPSSSMSLGFRCARSTAP